MTTQLITADIGNVNTKFRRAGGDWAIEPSVVRRAPTRQMYSFTTREPVRPLRYHTGPASLQAPTEDEPGQRGIDPAVTYLLGRDAVQHGVADVSFVGSAEARVFSAAYLLLHLYSVLASLPPAITDQPRREDEPITATVVFAGGLPMDDCATPTVRTALRRLLTGRTDKDTDPVPHHLTWGATDYVITIEKVSFDPQPLAALATLMFNEAGAIHTNGALNRIRLALDIGGGTTDYTGRRGLTEIPGTEGGFRMGIMDAAVAARDLIRQDYPVLRHLDEREVLQLIRDHQSTLYVEGDPIDVRQQLLQGQRDVAMTILARLMPQWEHHLASGEVILFGGGGKDMAGPLSEQLSGLTRITLLDNAILRVVDGLERLARHRLAR
ncbi:MAG: hypothetical protein HC828_03160 [Blastochloris sp.]|nr:hypothetical protein [Blastochloris sp.]